MKFRHLNVQLTFGRRATFFGGALLVPAIIVIQINIVGLFTLSEATGARSEKVSLGVSSILALSVLLLILGDILPTSSDPTPLLSESI